MKYGILALLVLNLAACPEAAGPTLHSVPAALPVAATAVPSPLPDPLQIVVTVEGDLSNQYAFFWGTDTLDLGSGSQTYAILLVMTAGANYYDYDDSEPYAASTWHYDPRWPTGATPGALLSSVGDAGLAVTAMQAQLGDAGATLNAYPTHFHKTAAPLPIVDTSGPN